MVASLKTRPSTRTRSERKLSEVASHLVIPSGITTTAWPGVRDRCASFGVGFDRWQTGIGQVALGKRETGKYAAGIGGVVMSIPRQVGKTYLIGWMLFALATILPKLTIIWTAHRTRTADETFMDMSAMAKRRRAAKHVANIRSGNGRQEIEFTNGSRILFGARESGFGRGFAKVDVLVLDEAQILSEKAMEDMVPATNAAPNGLVFMMGTPPRPTDPGEVFTNRRQKALDGNENTLYVEMSADKDANPDDRRQLRKANPSYPHRTSEEAIQRMRDLLGPDSFKREGLGIWDETLKRKHPIPKARWDKLRGTPPDEGIDAFGIRFSADGAEVALAAARRDPDGQLFVEGIRSAPMSAGTQWLVDFLVDRKDTAAQFVIDGRNGVGYLVEALREEGVRNKRLIWTPTADQVITAHTMFLEAVKQGTLSHSGQPELDAQVEGAGRRAIGKAGGWGWEAPEDGSVTLLEAATTAAWAAKTTRRRPRKGGRKQIL
ncbi:hypothetical protein NQ036_03695 [Brevibacterium sp. 91QC2O2]|uniref:hypothetical protein n=1 Tax=Brevibacterium TaxID=1696 RepID=UPI00211C03B5|nr:MULTISPECIES: hypothetical protein [unclassified Brevibacterium]MCQ9367350.1 hypothetical protein [Brevibacterium sp. 91QC2O2]MCQ9384637.1 hypothetical protein [Brevibacterium sp. 68QC2CO]